MWITLLRTPKIITNMSTVNFLPHLICNNKNYPKKSKNPQVHFCSLSMYPQRKVDNIQNLDSGRKSMNDAKRKKDFFSFYQCQKIQFFKICFYEKWHQGVLENVERNKVMKYEHIWYIQQCTARYFLPRGCLMTHTPEQNGVKVSPLKSTLNSNIFWGAVTYR